MSRGISMNWPISSATTTAAKIGRPQDEQESDDDHLRRRHHDAGELHRAPDAELDRQRADAETAIPLDRLEIVQGHDPVRAQAIQDRERDDSGVGQAAATTAAPVNHGKPSYARPTAELPHQPFCFNRSGGAE